MSRALTPSDADELLQQTLAFASGHALDVPDPDDEPWWTEVRLCATGAELLRGVVQFVGYAGDPALLPSVVEALLLFDRIEFVSEEPCRYVPFAETIRVLLRLGGAVDPAVRALVSHRSVEVRLALIGGLEDAPSEFEDLLRELARDPEREVRRAARVALRPVGEPPWWSGLFSRDPAEVGTDEEAEARRWTVQRWAVLMDEEAGKRRAEELRQLLDELPDELALDALTWTLAMRAFDGCGQVFAERLARIPGSLDLVIRLAQTPGGVRTHFLQRYARCDGVATAESARRAFDAAAEIDPWWCKALAVLFHELWPVHADLTDLVERVVADLSDREELVDRLDLLAAASPDAVRTLGARVVEGFLTASVGWSALPRLRQAVLEQLPPDERRAVARRALESEDSAVARWGAVELAPDHLAALCEHPRHRAVLATHGDTVRAHRDRFLGWLRDGDLSLYAASEVIDHLSTPGQLVRDVYSHAEPDGRGRLPLAPSDWDGWRRIRDAATIDDWRPVLTRLPMGPLAPDDRAVVARATEAALAGSDDAAFAVGAVLACGGSADDLVLMDELVHRFHRDEVLEELRNKLGDRVGRAARWTRGRSRTKQWVPGPHGPR